MAVSMTAIGGTPGRGEMHPFLRNRDHRTATQGRERALYLRRTDRGWGNKGGQTGAAAAARNRSWRQDYHWEGTTEGACYAEAAGGKGGGGGTQLQGVGAEKGRREGQQTAQLQVVVPRETRYFCKL